MYSTSSSLDLLLKKGAYIEVYNIVFRNVRITGTCTMDIAYSTPLYILYTTKVYQSVMILIISIYFKSSAPLY